MAVFLRTSTHRPAPPSAWLRTADRLRSIRERMLPRLAKAYLPLAEKYGLSLKVNLLSFDNQTGSSTYVVRMDVDRTLKTWPRIISGGNFQAEVLKTLQTGQSQPTADGLGIVREIKRGAQQQPWQMRVTVMNLLGGKLTNPEQGVIVNVEIFPGKLSQDSTAVA